MSDLNIYNTKETSNPSITSKEKETYEYFSTPENDLPIYVEPSVSTIRTYDESPRCHGHSPRVDTDVDNTGEGSRGEGRRRSNDSNRRKRRLGEGGKDLKERKKGQKKLRSSLRTKVSGEDVENDDSRRVRYVEGNEEISGSGVKGKVRHNSRKGKSYSNETRGQSDGRQSNHMTEVNAEPDIMGGLSPPAYDQGDYENDIEVINRETPIQWTPSTNQADTPRRLHREEAIPSTHPAKLQEGHATQQQDDDFQEKRRYPQPSPREQVHTTQRLPHPHSQQKVLSTEGDVVPEFSPADMAHFISKMQANFTSWVFNEKGDSGLVQRVIFFVFTLFMYFTVIYVFLTLLATFFHKQIQFTPFDWNAVGIN